MSTYVAIECIQCVEGGEDTPVMALKKKKFIYLFLITHRLSLVAVSQGYSLGAWASHCRGFSCCRAWALGHTGSAVAVLGLSCPEACGIFLDQGSNLSPLHRQVDS